MFRINVILTVSDPNDTAEISELLTEAGRLSIQEPGCERFDVYHSTSEPNVFILCEWWETEDAWRAHREEKAFREIYEPKVLPRVTRTPHFCELLS